MTFTQSFSSLAYNVTAIEQTDPSSGTGPSYLLNGLSDMGYWYQIGLAWNWSPGNTPGTGFDMIYAVFDSSGSVVFPSNQQYLQSFSGPVNSGDTILLNLYFSSTYGVVMLAEDYNTGASASETYSAEGASSFVGLSNTGNSNGFFTGLMTEWYHSSPYYDNELEEMYSNPYFALNSAWMWIDEFSCSDISCSSKTSLFGSTSGQVTFSNPAQLQEFAYSGATEYSDAYEFITGSIASQVSLTLSYSVQGGGFGYSAPVFTYISNGLTETATLSTSPTVLEVDSGTSWSVTNPLAGSGSTERWETGQATSGTATSSQSLEFVYYNQYMQTLSYSVLDSSIPPAPTFIANQFGARFDQVLSTAAIGYWFDGGSSWSVTNPIAGSAGERWEINSTLQPDTGTISGSETILFAYVHQFQVTFDVSPVGGGLTTPTGSTVWEDAGQVSISATPTSGYQFLSWSSSTDSIGFANGLSAKTVASISGSGTITANFLVLTVSEEVTITASPTGSNPVSMTISGCGANVGSIMADGNPHNFTADAECSLTYTATPETSSLLWEFSASGAGSTSWTYTTGSGGGVDTKSNTVYTLNREMAAFSVSGGGTGYSAPILRFRALGHLLSFTLASTATEVDMDVGGNWSITNPLSGSSATERWQAATSSVSGSSAGGLVVAPIYYNQYQATVVFKVADGGSSYAAPVFGCSQLGVRSSFNVSSAPANVWVDSGCQFNFTNPLPGSGSSERWESSNTTGTISKVTSLDPIYYNQFVQALSYSVIGGGSPSAPRVNGTEFGRTTLVTISSSPSTVWLDSGSTLSISSVLPPSDNQERWAINATLPIVVDSTASENLRYQHQFFVQVDNAATGGGTTSPASRWADSGSSITLSASPSSGWKFNAWNGTGSSSYSGNSNSPEITVNGPVNETGVFYPGLNLTVQAGGSVTYRYGVTEVQASAGNQVLYVQPGTNVSLVATPSSFFYSFGGWSISHVSSRPTVGIVVNGPTSIEASFSYNLLTIGVIVAVLVVVVGMVFLYRSRTVHKYKGKSPPGDQDLEDWVIPHRSVSRRTIIAIIGIAAVLIVGGLVALFPSTLFGQFGAAPVWHPFGGVFSSSGELASEDCSLGNLQPILGGTSAEKMTPQSTVACSYHGQDYQGVVGTDCNLTPTGPIPAINGTLVPYDGCVLSYAPLDYMFSGLFNLTARATSASLVVYSNQAVLANITTTAAWKDYHCSISSDNKTKTSGPMSCYYLGIPYSTTDPLTVCEFRTPIQVNGVAISQGACMLQRSETVVR